MKKSAFLITAAAWAVSVSFPAFAKVSTQEFVKKVSISDMFEIKSSELASQKSENAEIKDFASRMVTDHTKTTEELKAAIASSNAKAKPAADLDAKHKAMLAKLEKSSGKNFDARYVAIQKDAHKEAVNLFSDYSKHGDNADVKEFAAKTLPDLKDHLSHAKALKN